MGIYAKAKSKDFTPAPEGLHRAVCVDIVDKGMVEGQYGRKHKIRILWQIEERMDTGKPFLVGKTYTLSLHKKSSLRPDLESWRGKKFTDEEAEEFDLEKLLGANCQVNVTQQQTADGIFANVQAVVPAAKGASPLRAEDYVRKCDRDDWVPPITDEEPSDYDPGTPQDDDPIPF